jgi:transcription initiation factor TFIIIB Brf1 subunit/transcription initiation factor TFIIB
MLKRLKRSIQQESQMSSLFYPGVSTLTHVADPGFSIDPALFKGAFAFKDGFDCDLCGDEGNVCIEKEERVCLTCGSHYGFQINSTAEYRYHGGDDRGPDPTRVGHPTNPLLPESSGGTRILSSPGDNQAARRLRKYHQWNIVPYKERTLQTMFEKIQILALQAGISTTIVKESEHLCAQVSHLRICRGLRKDALLAACMFESLKRDGSPWRPADVANLFQIDVKLVTRGYKQLSGLLDEHLYISEAKDKSTRIEVEEDTPTHSTEFQHYLEPALSKLQTPRYLHGKLIAFATDIGRKIDLLGICSETTPSSLAGSALLLACEHFELAYKAPEVATVCSISRATLQKCMKRIEKWLPILNPPEEKKTAASCKNGLVVVEDGVKSGI